MSGSTANNVTPAEIAQCTAKMQQMVAASKYFEAQKYGHGAMLCIQSNTPTNYPDLFLYLL